MRIQKEVKFQIVRPMPTVLSNSGLLAKIPSSRLNWYLKLWSLTRRKNLKNVLQINQSKHDNCIFIGIYFQHQDRQESEYLSLKNQPINLNTLLQINQQNKENFTHCILVNVLQIKNQSTNYRKLNELFT